MLSRLGGLETALNSSHDQVADERQSRLTLSLVNPSSMHCRTYDPKSRGGEFSGHAPCEWLAAWESLVYGACGAIPRSFLGDAVRCLSEDVPKPFWQAKPVGVGVGTKSCG